MIYDVLIQYTLCHIMWLIYRTMFQFLGGVATYLVAWAILGQDNASQITAESSMGFMVKVVELTSKAPQS